MICQNTFGGDKGINLIPILLIFIKNYDKIFIEDNKKKEAVMAARDYYAIIPGNYITHWMKSFAKVVEKNIY